MYNYPTAKTRTLYKSTDGPTGWPADNPPNPDKLGDLHRTVPEMMVGVCWQRRPPIWQHFGCDPDPDPKSQSRTSANTRYNAIHWGSSRCCCAATACTRRGGCPMYWPLLCSVRGGSQGLFDICNARIVQRRWGDGVLTFGCRGYGTPSMRGIHFANQYGNTSFSRRKLRIPQRPTLLLILTISKMSNILNDQSRVKVRA
jgi:hypothetical protein